MAAITGPVERGDLGTVKNHLQALKRYPARRERYRVLALRARWNWRGSAIPSASEEYDALAKLLAEWQSK